MEAKLLKIDLSAKKSKVEAIPESVIKNYLGGRGLGAYLLYNLVPAKTDPLSPRNCLIFTAGPTNGTGFPFSSKANLSTKSPLTGVYLYSVSSGTVGHQIRKAGFWAVVIKGKAKSPTYLVINNSKVTFKRASSLWGLEPFKAQQAMLKDLPGKAASVAIGPAGEQRVTFASVFSEGGYYRAFGRGGAGCVMGAKNLKGMVICGDKEVGVADTAGFKAARKAVMDNIKKNPKWAALRRNFGTGADMDRMHEAGILPSNNWQGGTFERWAGISPSTTAEEWPRKNIPCGPYCPAICSHYVKINKGPYKGARCDGPEYETLYAFGSNCGVDKFDAIVAADQICDEFGIDTMTAGVTIGFAMECFEKGLLTLKDTDGIELRFGDDRAMIAVLKKMAAREGFGRRLLKGTRLLSKEIKGSEPFAMHAKGMEFGGYECRGINGQALQFAVSARGGCHHAYGLPARTETYDGTGSEIESRGRTVKAQACGRIIRDSFMACTFPGLVLTLPIIADALSAILGGPWSIEDLNQIGERIMCQERLFNMREGLTRKHDALPARLLKEPKPDGPLKGTVVPLEALKDAYYETMGWSKKTGNPGKRALKRLDIST